MRGVAKASSSYNYAGPALGAKIDRRIVFVVREKHFSRAEDAMAAASLRPRCHVGVAKVERLGVIVASARVGVPSRAHHNAKHALVRENGNAHIAPVAESFPVELAEQELRKGLCRTAGLSNIEACRA